MADKVFSPFYPTLKDNISKPTNFSSLSVDAIAPDLSIS